MLTHPPVHPLNHYWPNQLLASTCIQQLDACLGPGVPVSSGQQPKWVRRSGVTLRQYVLQVSQNFSLIYQVTCNMDN